MEKAEAASGLDIAYRFTGKERDAETGLTASFFIVLVLQGCIQAVYAVDKTRVNVYSK